MNNTVHNKIIIWVLKLSVATLYLITPIATPAEELSGDINRGARSWADNCSRCHNMREPSEFRDDQWEPTVNHMRIRAGIPGNIARDIRAFLQSSNYSTRTMHSIVDSGLSGQEIFNNTCIACHGGDGKGVLPGVPDLANRLSSSDDELIQRITYGYQSPGSTMAMPPKGGAVNLSDADIKRVLSHLRNQFGK